MLLDSRAMPDRHVVLMRGDRESEQHADRRQAGRGVRVQEARGP